MHKHRFIKSDSTSTLFSYVTSCYKSELFLLLSLLLFFTARSSTGLDHSLKLASLKVLSPSMMVLDSPFSLYQSMQSGVKNIYNVSKLNDRLMKENENLRKYLVYLEKDSQENIALKELLNFNKAEYDYTSARIFLNSAFSYNSLAILNIGSNNNVLGNQVVISGKGLVGRVYKVFNENAQVVLYNDPNSRISVYSSKSRERAIMYGDYNNLPYLEYLKKNHSLEVGEVMYTSGDGGVFFPDIPVGIVVKLGSQYLVQPFVSLQRLDFVSVITKKLL
ncbi:MAG: rod shape-determining protein MreC [Rickettsiales bacterium]|jgi:rod shape-determining protein MreC|nr:rod shape-determining protein MreC [Rickettsiales bacterium]